ncbi:hypothetical protein [Nocardioides limicola]|uniref:hypothetical protein n=1 Tax=Nocardioides limicola TaxID=2803368 RepID=UPI00193B9576|nr:hypothetical protein [Nocardioides sp. DJM-14]
MKRIRTAAAVTAATLCLAVMAALTPSFAASSVNQELAQVRAATAKYHDVNRAIAAGYELGSPCVPNMGYHYVRGVAADQSELVATDPEILVYAPLPNGKLRLVAVEYASWAPASLFGVQFDPPHGGPPFHTLHAWVWQANPNGVFAAQNPNVRC